jgi:hypothetical protein
MGRVERMAEAFFAHLVHGPASLALEDCCESPMQEGRLGTLESSKSQLDLADLHQRLGVRILRDVFHDFLRVRGEAGLESLNRFKEKMPGC